MKQNNNIFFIAVTLIVALLFVGCGNSHVDDGTINTSGNEISSIESANIDDGTQAQGVAETSKIDTEQLELLFEADSKEIMKMNEGDYPEGFSLLFDSDNRLLCITTDNDKYSIYGVKIGGYATNYVRPLVKKGWRLKSNHIWLRNDQDNESHTMVSAVYYQDGQELVLTSDISEDGNYLHGQNDVLISEISLLSCKNVDELADDENIEEFFDYNNTKVVDFDNPEAQVLSDIATDSDKTYLTEFYRLLKLLGREAE